MVYMLFDNPSDKSKLVFLNKYPETSAIKQIYPQKQCKSPKEMYRVCKDMIKQSSKGDAIICWCDFMAVICWWICKFQFKNRKIIALNILLKDKNSLKNKIAKILYKPVLNSIKATVTSKEYGEYIKNMLGIERNFVLLHDVYHDTYDISYQGEVIKNSVFCGGRNGRDWDFLIKLAQSLHEVTFNCVMPKDKFEQYKESFSKNMNIKTDISEDEYLKFMCQSEIVVMPLDTEAPAGLIALFQAAANNKLIITSDTITTTEYFSNKKGILLGKDLEDWKGAIKYFLKNPQKRDKYINELRDFLENKCSEKEYARIISELIRKSITTTLKGIGAC